MTLRWAAALAGMLGLALFLAYLHWVGRGAFASPEERHLREVKERATVPASVVPYTFADFAALPHGRPLAEVAALERRGVSLDAYTQFANHSSDGDYHLSLSETPPESLTNTRTITAELTPEFSRGSSRWSWEPLIGELRPLSWFLAPWPGGPRHVRISGWLLYDFQYDAPFLPQKASIVPGPVHHRLTGWEIHPVTRIELWDDSLARFVDYPR
jgi:hypothetical protein